MTEIKQTNRTMQFSLISPEAPDFLTLAPEPGTAEAYTDEQMKEINDTLVVHSYAEAEKLLDPKLYGFFNAENGDMVFVSQKPEQIPEDLLVEYPLGIKSPITGVLFNMVDAKSKQGARNVEFNFQEITSQLSPKKMQANLRQVRKSLAHLYTKHEALLEGDPARDDVAVALNALMEEARENFNNPLLLLSLAADDCQQRLLLGAADEQAKKNSKIVAGVLDFADDGTIKVLAAPKPDEQALALADAKANTALAEIIAGDYDDTVGDHASNYVRDLVVRTFSPLAATAQADYDLGKEVELHNSYLQAYTESENTFMKVAKPIIEQLLGIYVYFQQYSDTVSSKAGMRPSMLITNCDTEMLSMSRNITKLETYLATANNTNHYDETIWNAIIPNLAFSRADEIKNAKEVFKVNKENKKTDIVSMEVMATLIATMAKYQVRTFFSFETGEDTNFDRVSKDGIAPFQERCEALTDKDFSSYAIPCFPNITVIPKNKSGVITGKLLETDGETVAESQEREDIQRFYLNGIYIPAAYPCAGIVAAYMDPEFLREKYGKGIDMTLPGVRFDIEAGNNALFVPTTLAKEIAGFTQAVKQDINRHSFGFVLGSETQKHKGKSVSKLTVYKARSLSFDGRQFEPLFQTMVTSYFERILRQMTGDNKMDNITYFFSANPASQMSVWNESRDKVNGILQTGDEVVCEIDSDSGNCDIKFTFDGVQKNLRVELGRASKRATI